LGHEGLKCELKVFIRTGESSETFKQTWDRNRDLGQEGIKYKMKLFLVTGESSVTVRQLGREVYIEGILHHRCKS